MMTVEEAHIQDLERIAVLQGELEAVRAIRYIVARVCLSLRDESVMDKVLKSLDSIIRKETP